MLQLSNGLFKCVPSLSPPKYVHVTLRQSNGLENFLHRRKADQKLNMLLKFQVNRCIYADTVMLDVQLCQKRYNSPYRFVTLGHDFRPIDLSTMPNFVARRDFNYGFKLQI